MNTAGQEHGAEPPSYQARVRIFSHYRHRKEPRRDRYRRCAAGIWLILLGVFVKGLLRLIVLGVALFVATANG